MAGKFYQSSKGIASYPRLGTPDMKYAKTDPKTGVKGAGKFKTNLVLQEGPAKEFIDELTSWAEDELSKKQLKNVHWPYKKNAEDGTYSFSASSAYKVGIADSKGKLVNEPEKLKIGSGSVIKMKVKFDSYDGEDKEGKDVTYVLLRLNAVQLLKYVEFTGGAEFDPDETEEDGFSANEGYVAGDEGAASDKPKGDATSF